MDNIAIYALLLLAIIAGWVLGHFASAPGRLKTRSSNDIFADYFVGLNYLLNDEPDEAIDTFIKALEINSETIETHLALGALLRRRGKVDKAIQVHQALLARPGLDHQFSESTRLQLAIDYISAGLLDRAERLLNDVLDEGGDGKWDALKHLLTIYQTEKDWDKAIQCSSALLNNSSFRKDDELRAAAAHYCCELADEWLRENQQKKAREQIKKAFAFDRKNVRASLLLAKIEQSAGNYEAAIKELTRIRNNNPEFISKLLGPLAECYEQLQKMPEYENLLTNILPDEPNVSVVLALSDLVTRRSGEEAAIEFLNDYLTKKPSLTGLVELLRMQIKKTNPEVKSNLNLLQQMIDKLLRRKSTYQCHHCGYETKNLYWMCPSCQKWDKIKPIPESGSSLYPP